MAKRKNPERLDANSLLAHLASLGMSAPVDRLAILDQPRDLQILTLLSRDSDASGRCVCSQVKIAGEIGCSRGSVQRSLQHLIEAGLVRHGTIGDASRPSAPNVYRIALDPELMSRRETPQLHSLRAAWSSAGPRVRKLFLDEVFAPILGATQRDAAQICAASSAMLRHSDINDEGGA